MSQVNEFIEKYFCDTVKYKTEDEDRLFSKITPEGKSFACYQPDYFTGGGYTGTREALKQLSSEDIPKRYEITHGYPKHFDNSLSRYVWARACATWLKDGKL